MRLHTEDAFGQATTQIYEFDHVFDEACGQEAVFEQAARPAVECALQGINGTIFAYGQTGAGKTYTMAGDELSGVGAGIIPRSVRHVFEHIERGSFDSPTRFLVRAAYLQIYNEVISDLLRPERSGLAICEAKRGGVYVNGLSEWVVRSSSEAAGLLRR